MRSWPRLQGKEQELKTEPSDPEGHAPKAPEDVPAHSVAHDPLASLGGTSRRRLGDFELLSKLGQGAMGAVYLARQIQLDRKVAIKILPPELAQDQEFLERFRREARAAARLNNPHIVLAYDVGVVAGYHYIAMEYVDGLDLEQRLQTQAKGKFPPQEVLKIARHMGRALEAASAGGIVHRDIKPANILHHSDGTYKLTDLGLAARNREDHKVTQKGSAVGTPFYISPEQARGEQSVDVRSDIYSLGATLYHLATGRLPYPGDNAVVVMTMHLTEVLVPPDEIDPAVPKPLSRLIVKMMAKSPVDRHQSARELLEDIARAERGEVPLLKRARAKARSALAALPKGGPANSREEGALREHASVPKPRNMPLGGSVHPRLSRLAPGKKHTRQTGPLEALGRLPKKMRLAIAWGAIGLFLLVFLLVARALNRRLKPSEPGPEPAPVPAVREIPAALKTSVAEPSGTKLGKSPDPVRPAPETPAAETAPPSAPTPMEPSLEGRSLYRVNFYTGKMDSWTVSEYVPPKLFEMEKRCALARPTSDRGLFSVKAEREHLQLQFRSLDPVRWRMSYFLERPTRIIRLRLVFVPGSYKLSCDLVPAAVGQWCDLDLELKDFRWDQERGEERKPKAPLSSLSIWALQIHTGFSGERPNLCLRYVELFEKGAGLK